MIRMYVVLFAVMMSVGIMLQAPDPAQATITGQYGTTAATGGAPLNEWRSSLVRPGRSARIPSTRSICGRNAARNIFPTYRGVAKPKSWIRVGRLRVTNRHTHWKIRIVIHCVGLEDPETRT